MPQKTRMSVNSSNVLSVIMGGGQGTRLFPLTRDRSKPAVPLAGQIPPGGHSHFQLHQFGPEADLFVDAI
jgi:hypothetical protein